jgi:hypothetical protein
MTEELEIALRRTLKDAAERAPKAPEGIGRPGTHRVRRGPSRALLAAAAVVVAIAGTTIGGRALLDRSPHRVPVDRATAAPSPSLRAFKKTKVPPIEKVWPGVAFHVPNTLPNGRVFHPEAVIDAHTIAVSTDASFEKPDVLYAYDLRTHATRQITSIVTPPGTKVFPSDFTAGGGYVAWWLYDGARTEIWAAPIAGGPARLVAQGGGGNPSQLAIDGTDAVWSPAVTGGVYRAPLAGGGTARMVPGSASMHLLQWPWIGTPRIITRSGTIRDNFGVSFTHVKNAVTGETRSAHLTDQAIWRCGPTWCVGQTDHFVTEAQRRDGSGRRAIPRLSDDGFRSIPPILDRFVITAPSGGTIAVYDLRTGKLGDLGIRAGKGVGYFVTPRLGDPLYWTATAGGYVIVDLASI